MRRPMFRVAGVMLAGALAVSILGPVTTAEAAPKARYIVKTASASATERKVDSLRAKRTAVGQRYHTVLHGFSATLTADQVEQLRSDPSVESVVPDVRVHSSEVNGVALQSSPTWGLDRIDQRAPKLDHRYSYAEDGTGVTAYVIDTGVRLDQTDLAGRVSSGWDFVDGDADASDCPANYQDDPESGLISHGTHVAGTIAGKTWGVAKGAKVVAIRVLDCNGDGYSSDVIAALDWVMQHRSGPSVVNFSLGGDADELLDAAVAQTTRAGIPVVVAAGNDDQNACGGSPARAASALTVGATDQDDWRAWFSDYGSCVDLFAPGVDIRSAGTKTPSSSLVLSGTSMATPHVTGAVARYLQNHQGASPAQVAASITAAATTGVVSDRLGSPNRLLFPAQPPSAPKSVSSKHSNSAKTATISWKTPSSTGGAAISGYRVVRTGRDAAGTTSATVTVASTVRSYTFRKLVAGTRYTLSVQALNTMGAGPAVATTTTLRALPGAPTITSASSGSTKDTKTSVSLTWRKPGSGGLVQHYVITATRTSNGATKTITVTSSARKATISGLRKNARYTLSLRATNDSGKGPLVTWPSSVKAR
ncbi:MAG TPA: S8 family serine peptidase [Microlunatus sp.]|nr:S8 family serine peptidase [Microlunatus sp.]